MGVSPRHWWGWEPREETVFEYDADGRLLRTVTVREPEFDAEQRALLIASHRIETVPRNSLGIPFADAMDPKNEFRWIPPKAPTIDWSVKSQDDEKDKYYKKYPDMSRNGHMWRPPTLKD